jgi:hypothetical protein
VLPQAACWRAISTRGYADLSPPEAEHALLELPANRAEYIRVLQDISDYPGRSPVGPRIPTDDEIASLKKVDGRWRAVVLLDDERALRNAAGLFSRVFVLDPFYDSGAMLYAAWHDPVIKDEHARHLAEHAGLLIRAAPLLNSGTAVLAPDHLPGSWNPRPGWREPRRGEDQRQTTAWTLRASLVLLYWADRLDALTCTARPDLIAALDIALGPRAKSCALEVSEPLQIEDALAARVGASAAWKGLRQMSRHRTRNCLGEVSHALKRLSELQAHESGLSSWRLSLGGTWLPDPALLIQRALNGQDPRREPALPPRALRRRPLCLMPASV